jgi:hypothetical protein
MPTGRASRPSRRKLAAQNLRLIDMEAISVSGASGASAIRGTEMILMGERFGASQLQIGGGAPMAASQGQESVGQGGGSLPSVPASGGMGAGTGGGSVAEPLVVGPVMETSGAGMGGGSTVVQAQVGGQGGGSVPGAAASGGCHGGDGNRHRRRQRARHNERCRHAFRQ